MSAGLTRRPPPNGTRKSAALLAILIACPTADASLGFVASLRRSSRIAPRAAVPNGGPLSGATEFLRGLLPAPSGDADAARRGALKYSLLSLVGERGADRSDVEGLIGEIAPLSPCPDPSRSPLIRKEWVLQWTTEKEINFFIDWNISDDVTQTISYDGGAETEGRLGNDISFARGGGLSVGGGITPNKENPLRTDFEFSEASLDLGRWGKYEVPPVGKGWFDTVYLDDELRVDLNSRNDILICTLRE